MIYCLLNESWNIQMYSYMRSIGNYVSFFWIFVISTGELFIVKLMMALFINTYLKYFNSREKSPNELIEDELLNKAIADEA